MSYPCKALSTELPYGKCSIKTDCLFFKITHTNTYFILEIMLHIWFYILLRHLKYEYFLEPVIFIESVT